MHRDEARAYFKDKGLTYNDIELSDLRYLEKLLNEEFDQKRKEDILKGCPPYWKRVNHARYYKGTYATGHGWLICAYLTGRGEYFTSREVISFNRDGFIGFCGDADDKNLQPVIKAFIRWCTFLAVKKKHWK